MKIIAQEKNQYVLRLGRGEEVIETLQSFAQKQGIKGAFFFGLGAVEQVHLAYFDRNLKQYSTRYFQEPHELAPVVGNITRAHNDDDYGDGDGDTEAYNDNDKESNGDDIIVHAHGTLGNQASEAFAGHLQKAVVAITLEIIIILIQNESKLTRQLDPETGLKLLN